MAQGLEHKLVSGGNRDLHTLETGEEMGNIRATMMGGHVEAGRKLRKFLPDGLGFRREVGANEIC